MKLKPSRFAALSLVPGLAAFALSAPVMAQDDSESADPIEELVVTGSYIRRTSQFDSPSPIDSVDSAQLAAIGATSIANVVQTLTINTGSQNNPDAFTQNSTVGTSNFNLRGLGVASTLVLLNGKRQVLTGLPTNDGLNFVDTSSLVPLIAIDNVDILKDGAAALYGSDAVAGVVNFRTRNDFEGLEISADYQTVQDEGDSSEYQLQAIFGARGERSHVMAAVSFAERTPLSTTERRLSRPQDDSSTLGNPGSYFFPSGPLVGLPIIDPTGCDSVGGIPALLAPPGTVPGLDVGLCQFDFGDFFSLIPDETRFNGFARGSYDLTDKVELVAEFGFARNRAIRGNSPTFPNLRFPNVPAANPGNPFGTDVNFFGRAIGNGGTVAPTVNEIDTWRSTIELNGELDNGWYWQVAYVGAKNEGVNTTADTLAAEFQDALNGFGGTGCAGPTNPAAQPGVGPCQYFNPFASSFGPLPNSQDVINSFTADQVLDTTSELQTLEAVVSGDIFETAAGTASIAIGAQVRQEELMHDYNSLANQDRFAFVIGNPDFSANRDVNAAFVELGIPLADTFDLQLAVRYEDYGGAIGSTTDPKIAGIFRPNDTFTLRGSFSTSFRAPSLFQANGGSTSLNQISDPLNPGLNFAAVRSSANPNLQPEESDAINFGTSIELVENLILDFDYWAFDFTDVIIQENFQAVLNAFPNDTSRVQRVAGPGSPVTQINVSFANASAVQTDGIDFRLKYELETGAGVFQPFIEGTYILGYDVEDPQAGPLEGDGLRNFNNFGNPTPNLRMNAGVGWLNGAHSANLFLRYIGEYDDDQNCADGRGQRAFNVSRANPNQLAAAGEEFWGRAFCADPSVAGAPATLAFEDFLAFGDGYRSVDSQFTIDAQYSVDTAILFDAETAPILTIGVINATAEEPPQVFTNGGYDARVHDPRGRLVYLRLVQSF
ncbi:MAG: TonB-dependent receptor [Pseudomonadota bacterium]